MALGSFNILLFTSLFVASLVGLEKVSSFTAPKKKPLLIPPSEPDVIGEGEDYFLSLFGDSVKPIAHSFNTKKIWKHFSMILEEVGSSRSRYIFYFNYFISSIGIGVISQ